MAQINLAQEPWTLEGWRPFSWKLGRKASSEGAMPIVADIPPIEANIPQSVQENLRQAGLLPDWNVGLQSRECEWVEHRHWIFETVVRQDMISACGPMVLAAEGLDYSGWILIDDQEAAYFTGAMMPHRFDLTAVLTPGSDHRLAIVFEEPPREQGQMGYTSRSHYFKSRYNYSWDWCPRLVPVGIWGPIRLLTELDALCSIAHIQTSLAENNRQGTVVADVEIGEADFSLHLEIALCGGQTAVQTSILADEPGIHTLTLKHFDVEPWWPNGAGAQPTYTLNFRAVNEINGAGWTETRTVGFKRIEWLACEDAPPDAEPWICAVNGTPIFLQGANWVPPQLDFHSARDEEYQALIERYRDMGCNILRVWGGAILERECFYRLCDEAGLLVWQEFPLSSSGIENYPPEDPEVVDLLLQIASSYIRQRSHHVSLLLWCGGNELTQRDADATPITDDHPCIAALRALTDQEDPQHRFIATSASGPQFYAHPKNYGQGIHHDVHGPWGMTAFKDMADWRAYWENDDALFRSEVGMPGASSLDILNTFSGGLPLWPPLGSYWLHGSAWWIQFDRYNNSLTGLTDHQALAEYVRLTQAFQAEAYGIAAAACKKRFPRCGGFIIWMGHDLYPCPANNAVIDYLRQPKPAYFDLQRVFKGATE